MSKKLIKTWWQGFFAYLLIVGLLLAACGRATPTMSPESTATLTGGPAAKQDSSGENSPPVPRPSLRLRDNDIRFARLSFEQGLSQSVITSIVQDRQGFMWFGTQDGLNRYDGYEFKVYNHIPGDPNSLSDRWVTALYVNDAGTLWVGTFAGGLNRFDHASGQFIHYRNDSDSRDSLSSDFVQSVFQDGEGTLWVGTVNGLNRFNPDTGTFVRYQNDPDDPASLADDGVNVIYQGRDGALWIGTDNGLDRLNPDMETFTHYIYDPDDPYSLGDGVVQAIYEDREGVLWVGTGTGGLSRWDSRTERFMHYQNNPDEARSLLHNSVQAIYEDVEGVLWIGTLAGLERFDRETEQFFHYQNNPRDPNSLSNDNSGAIYQDYEGGLWIGTFGGGINYFNPSAARFSHYYYDPDDGNTINSNLVWSIYQDHAGDLWVGTWNGGLNHFEQKTQRWTYYQNDPNDPHSLGSDMVMSIAEDQDGVLWVGNLDGGGLNRFDRETGRFTRYQNDADDSTTLGGDGVLKVFVDRDNELWVGSGGVLNHFDRETEQFIQYQNDPDEPASLAVGTIATIYQDREGALWIGHFGGALDRFDSETGTFIHYHPDPDDPTTLSHDTVLSLYQDREGALWIGTGSGLNKYDYTTETFARYMEEDGLPNEVIYGILEDAQGNLWLSTNEGLSNFNPRAGVFRNYDVQDGLQSNEFNQGAYFQNSDGEMFFGGINGFNVFYPENITDNAYVPPIVLTSLTQAGQALATGLAVDHITEITLNWPNNFFEFEFAALSYTRPEENQYAYKLEGFEDNWNYMEDRRFGRYTNVPGGTYTLRVKGSNNDGAWNEDGMAVKVIVIPPFWQTWWFRILAAALVAGGIYGAFALRLRAIEVHRQQLETQVSARTKELRKTLVELERSKEAAEAANRAKSVFLTNMSHELRTPLNAVLGLTQLMARDENLTSAQHQNLAIINRSGEHLLGLINEVLELSKIEAGRIALNQQSFDLYRMLDGLEEMFRMRAGQRGLTLTFERAAEVPQYVWMDEGKLRQVFMNLLGNAVKFTEEGGVMLRAGVSVQHEDLAEGFRLCFEVEDTGPGIASEELSLMFAPFEQTETGRRSQEGTGLGLPISQQYVRLMGGELMVRQPDPDAHRVGGAGSIFHFEVPAALIEASDVQQAWPIHRAVGLEPDQPVYRLLIVEDNWANRRLLMQLLTGLGAPPQGFEVREAVNGQEGVEIWEEWAPHLIFMDMRMPVMDGYEATRRIKATTKGQATVIIALTASALEEDRSVILSEGCDAFIRKPFRETELFGALTKHLGVRFVYQALSSPVMAQAHEATQEREGASLVEAITALPVDWLADLQDAATRADLDWVKAIISRISARDTALGDGLMDLARAYDYDAILALLETFDDTPDAKEDTYNG